MLCLTQHMSHALTKFVRNQTNPMDLVLIKFLPMFHIKLVFGRTKIIKFTKENFTFTFIFVFFFFLELRKPNQALYENQLVFRFVGFAFPIST